MRLRGIMLAWRVLLSWWLLQLPLVGFCCLQLEVGLATKYPTLIALGNQGGAVYADQNAPEAIRDLSKLMAKQQYRNGTVVRGEAAALSVGLACYGCAC